MAPAQDRQLPDERLVVSQVWQWVAVRADHLLRSARLMCSIFSLKYPLARAHSITFSSAIVGCGLNAHPSREYKVDLAVTRALFQNHASAENAAAPFLDPGSRA